MHLGFIGLGRMGANMVRRLLLDDHTVVVYNRTPEKTKEIEAEGATASFSIEELVGKLEKPRAVWIMVPAGDATEAQIEELVEHLEPGDTIIDGGNTNFHDDVRRHADAQGQGDPLRRRRGLGRDLGPAGRLLPDGRRRARGRRPRSSRSSLSLAPEGGYLHVGAPGAGHYVKMVHNGIEYGLMQAYAEGLRDPPRERLRARPRRHLRAVDAGLRRALVAARAGRPRVPGQRPGSRRHQGLGRRLGRGPLDGPGGHRQGRPGAGHHACPADPASARARTIPTAPRCSPRCATSSAATRSRRSSRGGTADEGQGPGAPRGTVGSADPGQARPAREGRPADDEGAARIPPGQAGRRARSRPRTSCARACSSSASPIRRSSSCSGPPATSPIARSSRRSTSCGGPTSCPHEFVLLAIGRRDYDDDTFRAEIRTSLEQFSRVLPLDEAAWRVVQPADPLPPPRLRRPDRLRHAGRHARPDRQGRRHPRQPAVLPRDPAVRSSPRLVGQLGRVGLDHERHDGGWRRVVIEKPFGHDLESAKRLNREVGKVFRESQVYRIDHYLGKETVRNLLVFRFGNGIFEPLWNRRYVDHVQITVAESIGIENRGAFYEETGASRDVLQNHLLQLVSLVAMEPPATFEADALRDEKVKVLRAIGTQARRSRDPDVVRGQYGPGWVGRDPGPGLPPGAGRRSAVGDGDVRRRAVHDRRLALVRRPVLRPDRQAAAEARDRDRDPVPGGPPPPVPATPARSRMRTCWPSGSSPTRASCCASAPRSRASAWTSGPVTMDFTYGSAFSVDSPDAYETLILDALQGDASLFTRADEVEEAWSLIDPIVDAWATSARAGVPELRRGHVGPARVRRAAGPRGPPVAADLSRSER